MKIPAIIITGVVLLGVTGPAWGGYGGLKKELDNYTPPTLDLTISSPMPLSPHDTDAFDAEKSAILIMHKNWETVASQTETKIGTTPIPQTVIDAAADDARTADLLQSSFSIKTIQALVALRNPAIRGATQLFRAALEGFGQVAQLDEILRQYAAFTDNVKPGVGPMRGMDGIQMTFPFPGVMALKGEVVEKIVEAEKENLDRIRRDTITKVRKAYWNLLYTHRAQGITRDMLERLDRLDSVVTTRYGTGKTSYQDVAKIRIGREKLAEQLATLMQQRVNIETELLTMMDLSPATPIGIPKSTSPQSWLPALSTLYPLAIENRQELRRLRAMVGKMERMIEMAETIIQPDFSLHYSLAANNALLQAGVVDGRQVFATTISPTRGKGLPKNAWFGTQDAYLKETRRKLAALHDNLAEAEARTRSMVRMAWFELDRAMRERTLYQKRLLELSQTSLEVSTKGYESGSVTFADVIASYTAWFDIHLASKRRISDVGIAWDELQRTVGINIQKGMKDAGDGAVGGTP